MKVYAVYHNAYYKLRRSGCHGSDDFPTYVSFYTKETDAKRQALSLYFQRKSEYEAEGLNVFTGITGGGRNEYSLMVYEDGGLDVLEAHEYGYHEIVAK